MKLSIPSSFLAAAILADSATARRQRRSNRNSANAAKQRPPRPRSLVEAAAEGIGMPNSMSFDMMGVGGAYIKGNSGSGKSRKEPKKYDVEAEVDIEYTTGCGYLLTFSFKHDDNFPVPDQPATQCDPVIDPPAIYEYDELPYLAGRQIEIPFPSKIYEETGFASQGIDFNPCGHPPFNVFNVPHYDMHFYTSPLEIREGWTCAPFPPAPAICDFTSEQTSASGRAFFNVDTIWTGVYNNTEAATFQPANMPNGFTCDMSAAVPVMGTHCHNYATQPSTAEDWTEPVLVMGSYDGNIAFLEAMAPLSFVSGQTDNDFGENVVYAGQTIESLPSSYNVKYDATTGRTTATLTGRRVGLAACEEELRG